MGNRGWMVSITSSIRYFDEVEEGSELPSLVKDIKLEQLGMYAAASWDIQPLHYDSGTAQRLGFRAALADGPMVTAFLVQVVTDWMGIHGIFKAIHVSYRGAVFPDGRLTCKGKVVRKYQAGEVHLIECTVWAENQEREKVMLGTATVMRPCKPKCPLPLEVR
jgi:acyl dehydratase